MTPKTARPPSKKAGGKKSGTPKTVARDGGLERIYARLSHEDKADLDRFAREDERSTMKYVERLIKSHLDQKRKKQGK
jgi:hypothetical protein